MISKVEWSFCMDMSILHRDSTVLLENRKKKTKKEKQKNGVGGYVLTGVEPSIRGLVPFAGSAVSIPVRF